MISPEAPIVLVLAGGSVNEKLRHLGVRADCPALLPVHTRPVSAYILDFYLSHGVRRILLAIETRHVVAVRKELIQYKGRFEIVSLPPTSGVVESLRVVLARVPAETANVVVNVVTTIPTSMPAPGVVVLDEGPLDRGPVSAVGMSAGRLKWFLKGAIRPPTAKAFTGLFCLSGEECRQAAAEAERADDLLAVVKAARATEWRSELVEWIDCGHEANFYAARARLTSSRSFNRITVNRRNGTVKKRSAEPDKLRDESDFLQMLPSSVSIYFPRLVVPFSAHDGAGEYEMEYYGYPNVAEYLLYWDLSPPLWRSMFGQMADVLKKFQEHAVSLGPRAHEDFYLKRTEERLERFLGAAAGDDVVGKLSSGRLRVNGVAVRPLEWIRGDLASFIPGIYDERDFCIMHGDFCFNNILYDVGSGIVRLVDPRGSFGPTCKGIYGDRKYDLAKLMHSVVGRYDVIVNGLFDLRVDGSDLNFSLGDRAAFGPCEEAFNDLLVELRAEPGSIRALMGLLFITMPPLHADSRERQIIFFAHGLRMLSDTFS